MKNTTTVLELIGLAAIVAGIALIWIPAALIAAGAGLIGLSWTITRSSTPTGGTAK